ncbi:MAG: hypothetical protein Gyms2KO_42920 [Gymnodinialimonas sp.]
MDALSPDLFAKILNRDDCHRFVETHLGRSAAHFTECTFPDLGFDLPRFYEVLRDTVWGSKADLKFLADREKDSAPVDWSSFVTEQGVLTLDQILRLKAARTTIYARQMHLRDQSLRHLVQSLGRTGYFRARVNAFFTPAHGRGTAIHFDQHDVLALQVHGSKIWTVDQTPVVENVMFEMGELDGVDLKFRAPTEYHLKAGEALYVPRGVMHSVETLDEDSLHLVVGLRALNWHDVALHWVEREMKTNPAIRAPVPARVSQEQAAAVFGALSDPEVLQATIQSALKNRAMQQGNLQFGQIFARDIAKLL